MPDNKLGKYAAMTAPKSTITQATYTQINKIGTAANAPYTKA